MLFPRIVQSFLLPVLSLLLVTFNTPLIGQEAGQSFVNGDIRVLSSCILDQDQSVFVILPAEYAESDRAYPVHYVTDAPALALHYSVILGHHVKVGRMPGKTMSQISP